MSHSVSRSTLSRKSTSRRHHPYKAPQTIATRSGSAQLPTFLDSDFKPFIQLESIRPGSRQELVANSRFPLTHALTSINHSIPRAKHDQPPPISRTAMHISHTSNSRTSPHPSETDTPAQSMHSAPSPGLASSPHALMTTSTLTTGMLREVLRARAQQNYPGITPHDDFDILTLGSSAKAMGEAEGRAWLSELRAASIVQFGTFEKAVSISRQILDAPAANVMSGLKPHCNTDPGVFVQPIPNSAYSLRLFPGATKAAEYCMDFVSQQTGEPKNSPFPFELWTVGDVDAPWLSTTIGKRRAYSVERHFGIAQHEIEPGAEKFLLMEGQAYLLKRPGHRDLRFTVPMRHCPGRFPVPAFDVLSFPQKVVV